MQLDRRLRSSKPEVHYYITSPLPPQNLALESPTPTPLTVTPNSTFGATGGHERFIDSPQRAEEEEEGVEEAEGVEELEGQEVEESGEGERMKYSFPRFKL